MDYEEKMKRCHEYVEALEVERQKIQVFQRELPLCLELVTQAIDACKKQLSEEEKSKEYFNAHQQQQQQSETSEQTSSHHEDDVPVFEEFIPIKRSSSSSSDCDNDVEEKRDSDKVTIIKISNCCGEKSGKKSDWLRSVQLWNQTPDLPLKNEELPGMGLVTDAKKKNSCGAFKPFNSKEKSGSDNNNNNKNANQISTAPVNKSASSSTTETITGGSEGSKREEKEGQSSQSQRKQRRCWSPELHRRFLHSLQQLGGPHVATPKQIRELMKVDGLTNDEVKSHLQKYRLHTRRPSPSVHNNGNSQAPQFVVVGGIWVPPPEYAKMAPTGGEATGSSAANNGIYAPVATPAVATVAHKEQKQQSSTHRSRTDEGGRCSSPTSSSSTHTSTASPVY